VVVGELGKMELASAAFGEAVAGEVGERWGASGVRQTAEDAVETETGGRVVRQGTEP
jgi:hypothetical protein